LLDSGLEWQAAVVAFNPLNCFPKAPATQAHQKINATASTTLLVLAHTTGTVKTSTTVLIQKAKAIRDSTGWAGAMPSA
jgi:hypothetical protein